MLWLKAITTKVSVCKLFQIETGPIVNNCHSNFQTIIMIFIMIESIRSNRNSFIWSFCRATASGIGIRVFSQQIFIQYYLYRTRPKQQLAKHFDGVVSSFYIFTFRPALSLTGSTQSTNRQSFIEFNFCVWQTHTIDAIDQQILDGNEYLTDWEEERNETAKLNRIFLFVDVLYFTPSPHSLYRFALPCSGEKICSKGRQLVLIQNVTTIEKITNLSEVQIVLIKNKVFRI